jgi:chromosome segregation protein
MRLTKLKLAGFKSFVDPTTLALPGQLVGVVGPNGCGKSNVMDSVRWVLGESKASELRGESMQDVIFNGSGTRKPVSRAAVELVFDNTLGRLVGQWSQYAELSVKRLLTRNGQSEYYINNLHVRRKDVTDLFLGTGLGPRAYAIIGQGTISRIIEAKPDELRVFLEEAAGVTRYKERRKETENRLADTRENLARVEDIRLELGSQMERLEGQASVARQYREYHDELTRKQQLQWLLRRNEAQSERARLAREVEQAGIDLEARNAALRDLETQLEEAREAHFAASDGVHAAQSDLFAANAEVARLEAEIRHRRESRREYETRLAQLTDERLHWQAQAARLESDDERWQGLLVSAEERVEQGQCLLEARQERLPLAEDRHSAALEAVSQQRTAIAQAEQRLHVEQANRSHAQRSLQITASRRERLALERQAMPLPDADEFADRQTELAELRERISALLESQPRQQRELPLREQQRREVLGEVQHAQKERAEANARRVALQQLQQRLQSNGKLDDWLRRHGLQHGEPLWKSLHVEAGWEDAVEAVLRERLSALPAKAADPAWSKRSAGQQTELAVAAGLGGLRGGSRRGHAADAPTLRRPAVGGDSRRLAGRGADGPGSGGGAGQPQPAVGQRVLRDAGRRHRQPAECDAVCAGQRRAWPARTSARDRRPGGGDCAARGQGRGGAGPAWRNRNAAGRRAEQPAGVSPATGSSAEPGSTPSRSKP